MEVMRLKQFRKAMCERWRTQNSKVLETNANKTSFKRRKVNPPSLEHGSTSHGEALRQVHEKPQAVWHMQVER
jgi:hypothetical protein